MLRKVNYLGFFLALIFLSACSQLGAPKPVNLEQSLAYSQVGLETAFDTITALVISKSITPQKARDLQGSVQKGRSILETTKLAAKSGNITEATTGLEQINAILMIVNEALVAAKGAK
jgi:hypothetical protein